MCKWDSKVAKTITKTLYCTEHENELLKYRAANSHLKQKNSTWKWGSKMPKMTPKQSNYTSNSVLLVIQVNTLNNENRPNKTHKISHHKTELLST